MLTVRRVLSLALPALVVLSSGLLARAQEADSDQAAALLKQGVAQFKVMDFTAAKASLLKVDRDLLSNQDKAVLDEHLAKIDSAIRKQSEAMASYSAAAKALKANDLARAKELFAAAAECEYLPEPVRRDAKAQLALVEAKLQASPAPATRPVVMVVTQPAPEVEAEKAQAEAPATKPAAKTPAEEVAELRPEPTTRPVAAAGRLAAPVAKPSLPPRVPAPPEPVLRPVLTEAPPAPTSRPAEILAVKPAPEGEEQALPAATTQPSAMAPEAATAPAVAIAPATQPAATAPAEAETARIFSDVLARRSQANRLVSDGKAAMADNQLEAAIRDFQQALALVPEMEEAKQLRAQAQELLAATGGQAGPLSVLEQKRRVRKQQSDVEFDKALARSAELLLGAKSGSDFDNAADSARVGRNVVQANKDLYGAAEYRDRLLEVENRLEGLQQRRADWEKAEVQRQLDQMTKAEAERAQRARQQLADRVTVLTQNAKAMRSERRYGDALEIVKQVQSLDPSNYWAADQAEMLEQFILLQDQRETADTGQSQESMSLKDVRDSQIPWYQHLIFPRNWRQITQEREGRGLAVGYGSEEDRRIREALKETIDGKMDIEDTPLVEALERLRDETGLNIWPNWKYLESAGYTKESAVVSSVHLVKVPYEKALQVILEDASGPNVGTPQEISYVIDAGVITITTKDDLSRKVFPRVYPIQDLVRALSLARRDFQSFGETATGTTGTGVSGTTGTGATGTGETGTGGTGVTGTSLTGGTGTAGTGVTGTTGTGGTTTTGVTGAEAQVAVDNIITMITNTIAPESWVGMEGGEGRINVWSDQLIVTQTAANHQAIGDLITQLREAKDIEIAIEARFITVNTGYLESIGVDMDFYFNLGSRLGSTRATDPWTGATVPRQGGASGWGTALPGNERFTPISARQNPSFGNMLGVSTPMGSSIGSLVSAPAASVQGTFLDDIQVDFLIQATQAHQATRTLTAPRVTLLNGTAARIYVGRELSYIESIDVTEPATTAAGVIMPPTLTYNPAVLSVGTELFISATVSADLKYVTITVEPSVTKLLSLNFFPYDPRPVLERGGTIPPGQGFVQLYDMAVETIQTTVNVPDGATLLLGGLKSSGEVEREIGVPLLSKIPIINRAFTNRGRVSDEETLLILIKPNIIIPRDQEKKEFP